ncbi:MAG: hypothetical protein J1F38_04040 [Muribaculaceae bacterium]|nr:hypothetical protein [Muribaculaceae bacterium]
MKYLKRNISLSFILPLIALMVSSCSRKDALVAEEKDQQPRIILKISPVSQGQGLGGKNVEEMIRSLRIIMLTETKLEDGTTENFIEFNRYIDYKEGDYQGPGEIAAGFKHIFTRPTVNGKKKFYILANEESVGNIKFQKAVLPSWISDAENLTLSDFLNHYTGNFIPGFEDPGVEPGEGEANGDEFEEYMNSVYFSPDLSWSVNTAYPGQRAEIYLPYSSYYDGYEINGDSGNGENTNILDVSMYLVPCATKFFFKFINNRPYDEVAINGISLGGIASQNFVFPQLSDTEKTKKLNYQNVYWIDWMNALGNATVESDKVNNGNIEDNMAFNNLWGWIKDFEVPEEAYDLESLDEENPIPGIIELKPYDGQNIFGTLPVFNPNNTDINLTVGPFYIPESHYLVEKFGAENTSVIVQEYYLTLDIVELTDNKKAPFTNTPLGTFVPSLFRNTCVLIIVKLGDKAEATVYGEIQPWNTQYSQSGYLIEEPEYEE